MGSSNQDDELQPAFRASAQVRHGRQPPQRERVAHPGEGLHRPVRQCACRGGVSAPSGLRLLAPRAVFGDNAVGDDKAAASPGGDAEVVRDDDDGDAFAAQGVEQAEDGTGLVVSRLPVGSSDRDAFEALALEVAIKLPADSGDARGSPGR